MFKPIYTALLLGAISCSFLLGCERPNRTNKFENTNPNATRVTLGYLPITHALAVFEEKELLDKENGELAIELKKFNNWSDLTDALNAGRIDGASVLIELAMSAKQKGVDLKAVALGHKDGNVVVVSNKIKSASELRGKTIAIPSTQSSHNILIQETLSRGGLTLDDVSIVQLAPTEMPFSLASRAIDAFCVAEPFGAQVVSQGFGRVLFRSEELWEDSICCGLVLNQKSIDALGPEKVRLLVEKYYEAGAALDDEHAKSLAKDYLGQSPDVLDASLQWIRFNDLRIEKESYEILREKVRAYKINDNPPAYEEFVYQFD